MKKDEHSSSFLHFAEFGRSDRCKMRSNLPQKQTIHSDQRINGAQTTEHLARIPQVSSFDLPPDPPKVEKVPYSWHFFIFKSTKSPRIPTIFHMLSRFVHLLHHFHKSFLALVRSVAFIMNLQKEQKIYEYL